mmetsp:Transcript_57752/g.124193  ORF Transcript_57752/g.124193 Transcript_57752/m.124193 type:complete len:209 (+) Transcript_57752:333-959(+)
MLQEGLYTPQITDKNNTTAGHRNVPRDCICLPPQCTNILEERNQGCHEGPGRVQGHTHREKNHLLHTGKCPWGEVRVCTDQKPQVRGDHDQGGQEKLIDEQWQPHCDDAESQHQSLAHIQTCDWALPRKDLLRCVRRDQLCNNHHQLHEINQPPNRKSLAIWRQIRWVRLGNILDLLSAKNPFPGKHVTQDHHHEDPSEHKCLGLHGR